MLQGKLTVYRLCGKIAGMARSHLFIKVEIEHEPGESLEKRGAEICRQIHKVYGVRRAELANVTRMED